MREKILEKSVRLQISTSPSNIETGTVSIQITKSSNKPTDGSITVDIQ